MKILNKKVFYQTGIVCLICVFSLNNPSLAQNIKVACVGNSITYGSTLEDRLKEAYPAQLQGLLGRSYEVKNFGKPGTTLLSKGHRPYIEQTEYKDALAYAADIVIIHLGINDTDPRNWPYFQDNFVRDYVSLIESFKQINPHCRILIAKMTPITYKHPRFSSGTKTWHTAIQSAIETVAQIEKVQLIDFHTPLYADPFLLPDAVHPNKQGATRLAQCVYKAVTGDFGGLSMSVLYTDNMIFQRNIPITIKGKANANEQVKVSFGKEKKKTYADWNGDWSVTFQPFSAGGPYQLKVSTETCKLEFNNVLVGEVWLCSGQSNMAFMLKDATTGIDDIHKANHPDIRIFNMQPCTSGRVWNDSILNLVHTLQFYQKTEWQSITPETAPTLSAVAYYFGQMLHDSLHVPIGLICNAVGGSPIESWIDRNDLETHIPSILNDWTNNDYIQPWVRKRAKQNISKSTNTDQHHPFEPSYLYNTGIKSLYKFPIQGVIWYQGESNEHNIEIHKDLFHILVNNWRTNWSHPDMPFYFVQLSSLNRPSWPNFRNSQRQLMNEIPHTGMVVSSDKGDSLDVHPKNKKEIGERLARWALFDVYHRHIVPSGPLYKSAGHTANHLVEICFDYAEGLKTSDNLAVKGFEVAEYDGIYYPAEGKIQGNRILLSAKEIKNIRYVRYAWEPFTRANLTNGDNLPASTFKAIVQ